MSEICERAGLQNYDVSRLWGFVRGYLVPDVADARRALQPLMMAYGFDAIERDGVLVFRNRDRARAITLETEQFALHDELGFETVETRSSEADMSGRVRLNFVEADGDYRNIAEESVLPDEETHAVAESEIPILMTRPEGRQSVERWLSEARVGRDTVQFALPLSQNVLGAGDVVDVPSDTGRLKARIDRVEQTTHQLIEGVRIEPEVYHPADFPDDPTPTRRFVPTGPVSPLFLDLPLLRGDEVPHAPYLAVSANPWPGNVAVYDAPEDAGYELNGLVTAQSTVGSVLNDVPTLSTGAGLIDLATTIDVQLFSGHLSSISETALLAGGNLAAIGSGDPDQWEIIQFREAELIGANTWRLSHLLRGQAGTDALVSDSLPAASSFVLLDGTPQQIDLAAALRRQVRHFRIGQADKSYDHASYRHVQHAFEGNGLRPYSPVHLMAQPEGGELHLSWIRRARIEADAWELADIPLDEDNEMYRVSVFAASGLLREVDVSMPTWTYTAAMQASDGFSGVGRIEVAQISSRFGPGPAARLELA